MNEMLKKIGDIGIIPVIKIDEPEKAVPLAKALCDGGLPLAEITFRTACAGEAIASITKALPDMIVGAGTVLTIDQVKAALDAGAKFIVSPGINPKVVTYCVERGIPVTPGCSNAADIELALELGMDVVKFFPAEAAGGLKMIKALSAPFSSLKFIPTGGIDETNLLSYLSFDKILACGGSFMVKEEYIKSGDFGKITALTSLAVRNMLGFTLAHVGINCADEAEAASGAAKLDGLFGFEVKNGNSSIFSAALFEWMKKPGAGKNGHIAIGVNFMARAIAYLKSKGVEFVEPSPKPAEGVVPSAIYIKGEISGFAFHLVQKK